MEILRLAAFSQNGQGGNPAGVAFCEEMPAAEAMMSIAKEVVVLKLRFGKASG